MVISTVQNKLDKVAAAQRLLPLYEDWRAATVQNDPLFRTKTLEAALWKEVGQSHQREIPTNSEHAVGRWIARVLGREWTAFEGVST